MTRRVERHDGTAVELPRNVRIARKRFRRLTYSVVDQFEWQYVARLHVDQPIAHIADLEVLFKTQFAPVIGAESAATMNYVGIADTNPT